VPSFQWLFPLGGSFPSSSTAIGSLDRVSWISWCSKLSFRRVTVTGESSSCPALALVVSCRSWKIGQQLACTNGGLASLV